MDWLWKDLAYGARGLRKQPGFTGVAIVTLALGIGAATTIFSAIQNILLDPFPYTDARSVVAVQIHDNSNARPGGRTFYRADEFLDLQEQTRSFGEVIGGSGDDVLWNSGEGTEQFTGGFVTPNTFQFLGVPALIGRGIVPADAQPGAPPVFVMAYKLWVRRFNSDPSILGRSFTLNGSPRTLVGVMPKRFTKLGADLWMAKAMERKQPEYWMFQAKLKPGVTVAQAQADAEIVVRRLAKIYSDNYPKNFSVQIVSWVESLVGQFGKTLYTIAAAVALLLLIACGNVANMLLARGTAREKEMAIRSSLGASRSRIIGQLLAESLLLAAGGAILGCFFAYAGIQGLVALIPDGLIPREAQIRLNLPVLLFSLATAAATAILFGLAPALATARRNLVEPLKDAGKGVSGGFRKGRLRNALVVAEVALSLILLSGAGLLIRSFVRLQTVDLGFSPDNLLFARIPFPRGQYESAEEKQRFFRELLPRVQRLHGVAAATESTGLPPFGGIRSDIEIPGQPQNEKRQSVVQLVSEGYFPTLQLKVLRGRTLSESEVNAGRKLAVVNQTLVNRFLPGDDPIGKPIRVKLLETLPRGAVRDAVFEIVGVVSDAKNQGIQEPVLPEMYVPHSITGQFFRAVIVRTTVPPQTLLKDVQREVWAVDRSVALTDTGSLDDFLQRFMYAEPRFGLVLMAVFAGVGLALVALGVFSVIAYTVSRQTHEIGVRMALGAGRGDVLRMVLSLGGKLLGSGIALGLVGAIAATRVLAAQLWGVSPRDPLTLAAVAAVVAIAGFAACYFPARRATRVDPLIALRYE
jgi:putative ABC transport system permease protein